MFGAGSFNWYHWLIEILPIAYLAEKLPPEYARLPFLVPAECLELESFRASLEIFLEGRSIVTLSRQVQYQVGQLVVIDSPVNGPFSMRPGCWPTGDDYRQNNRVLEQFRDRIIDYLALPQVSSRRHLFLARGNRRRQYNQQEIEAVANAHGFETVYPESLSFREQVRMFRDASCVVGGTGAAWAGLLFCRPGVRALIWSAPEYRGFCAYSNLARLAGVDLRYIFVDSESVLKTTEDAYKASHRVDPAMFAAELGCMVNDEEWAG